MRWRLIRNINYHHRSRFKIATIVLGEVFPGQAVLLYLTIDAVKSDFFSLKDSLKFVKKSAPEPMIKNDWGELPIRVILAFWRTMASILLFRVRFVHTERIVTNSFEKRVEERRNSIDKFIFQSCERFRRQTGFGHVGVPRQGNLRRNTK